MRSARSTLCTPLRYRALLHGPATILLFSGLLVLTACAEIAGIGSTDPATRAPGERDPVATGPSEDPAATEGRSACGDVANDATNCGACGHSCRGGSCSSGLCATSIVLQSTTHIDAFVTDGAELFTIEAQAARACSAAGPAGQACRDIISGEEIGVRLYGQQQGGPPWNDWGGRKQVAASGAIMPTALAMAAGRVIFAEQVHEAVIACPANVPCTALNVGIIDASHEEESTTFGRALAVGPSNVTWAEDEGLRSSRIPLPGFVVDPSSMRSGSDTEDTARIQASSTEDVFWISSEGLHSSNSTSASAERWSTRRASDFAIGDEHIYLADTTGLYRVSRADRSETLAAAGSFQRVSLDARGVYATRVAGGRTTVLEVRGNKTLDLAIVDGELDGLAVAGDHVYFAKRVGSGTEIHRVPR
ncbi:MAG: hypothetical protein K0S65_2448 [Labilithrix sp.]|nr:hypothetical protein [Labilithrix sp.]